MKNVLLFFSIWILAPLWVHADTLILKNGMRLESERIWEEKGEIRCDVKGVILGFPRKDVLRIEKKHTGTGDPVVPSLDKLERIRRELLGEYEALLRELEALSRRTEKNLPAGEFEHRNKAVMLYNKKVAEYEEKRKAYDAAVEAYRKKKEKENSAGLTDRGRLEKTLDTWIGRHVTDFIAGWGRADEIFHRAADGRSYRFVLEIKPTHTRDIYIQTDPSGKITGYRTEPGKETDTGN
jgi:hypothetical protein